MGKAAGGIQLGKGIHPGRRITMNYNRPYGIKPESIKDINRWILFFAIAICITALMFSLLMYQQLSHGGSRIPLTK